MLVPKLQLGNQHNQQTSKLGNQQKLYFDKCPIP